MFKLRSYSPFALSAALVCLGTIASADVIYTHVDPSLLHGNVYLTDGSDDLIIIKPAQSTERIASPTWGAQQSALGVITSGPSPIIRTTGLNSGGNNYGLDYDLNGNALGGHYPQTAASACKDGTSDGTTYNYEISNEYGAIEHVYRCNTDWSNATVLFDIVPPGGAHFHGITYDPSGNGSLWLSTQSNAFDNGGSLVHVDLGGNVISSTSLIQENWPHAIDRYSGADYGPIGMSHPSALMRDPSTGYVWIAFYTNGTNFLAGYGSGGEFVGATTWVPPLYMGEVAGGEIAVPEPGTVAMWGTCALALAFYRWRKRK
jgi:hypothetical protein